MATAPFVSLDVVQAKQLCSATPSDQHGYWSWRIIDGRKCWYEGKPMLSKSSLEWPAQASAPAGPSAEQNDAIAETRNDPLDAQAWAPAAASDTFEAMWRDRIEQH